MNENGCVNILQNLNHFCTENYIDNDFLLFIRTITYFQSCILIIFVLSGYANWTLHKMKKPLMENFIFCAVSDLSLLLPQ